MGVTRQPAVEAEFPAQTVHSRAIFCDTIVRSLRASLACCADNASPLSDDLCDRCLTVLGYALKIPEAWPDARDLITAIASPLRLKRLGADWIAVLERAIDCAETENDKTTAARFHLELGRLLLLGEHILEARERFEAAHLLAELSGDLVTLYRATERLTFVSAVSGDHVAAHALANRTLMLAPACGVDRALIYHTMGYLAVRESDYQTAIEHYSTALQLRSAGGATLAAAKTLRDMGIAYAYLGEFGQARNVLDRAIEAFARFGDQYNWAMATMDLGIVLLELSQPAQSVQCLDRAESVFVTMGAACELARLYNNRGRAQQALAAFDEATRSFEVGLHWARAAGAPYEIANTLDSLAVLYLRLGQRAQAAATWRAALDELARLPDPPRCLADTIERQLQLVSLTAPHPNAAPSIQAQ